MKPIFNEEEKKYFYKIYKNRSTMEIASLLNKKFGKDFTKNQMQNYLDNNHLRTNVGNIGGYYSNNDKIGTKKWRFSKRDGKQLYIKAPNKKWVRYKNYLYKKYKGDIPNGYVVIFLDGNRENFDLDNLQLISRRIDMLLNYSRCKFSDKEMTKTSILAFELGLKSKDKERII